MSDRREMTCFGLLSVTTGMLLTVAAAVSQAQYPIALRCQPGRQGVKVVRGISFSPDGRWLAAGMHDKIVLWDISTRQIMAELPVAKGSVSCLAFSPDGRALAAGQSVNAIRIWDGSRGWTDASETELIQAPVIDRQKPGNLPEKREQVSQVAFSGDGEVLAWSSGAPTSDYRVHECVKPDHWIFAGTGRGQGDAIPGLVGWEHHGSPAKLPGPEVVAKGTAWACGVTPAH